MSETVSSKLYQRISQLRWQAPILAFILVVAHQLLEHTVLSQLPHWWHFTSQVLFYGLVGPLLAWWALTSLRRSVGETAAAERALRKAHSALSEANEQLSFLIRVSHRLAEAADEETLSTLILELPKEVVPSVGSSLILFDQRMQPLPVLHHGRLEQADFEAWADHLKDSEIIDQCKCCSVRTASSDSPCALLEVSQVARVYCLELNRGNQRYGILSIYLEDDQSPTTKEMSLLKAMAQEMSLAVESQSLRSRELAMLFRLRQAHRLSNLQNELAAVLEHTVEALSADGCVLFLTETDSIDLQGRVEKGKPLGEDLELIRGLAAGTQQSDSPLIIGDLEQAENPNVPANSEMEGKLGTIGQFVFPKMDWTT